MWHLVTYKTLGVTGRTVAVSVRLTARSKVLLETLTVPQLIRKPVPVYIFRMFIAVVTTARNLSLSWAKLTQSTPCNLFYGLILFPHLRLGLPSGGYPSELPTKSCTHIFSLSDVPHTLPISLFFISWPQ
jgi:hypothetical protein